MTDSEYWARYYTITGERPAWGTVLRAIELFAAEEEAERLAGGGAGAPAGPRLAVPTRPAAAVRRRRHVNWLA